MRKISKIILLILTITLITGCDKTTFQNELIDVPLGLYIENHKDISSFFDIYEAWKYNIKTIYINTGIDKSTNTYLIEKMPTLFNSIINVGNEYDMNIYAFSKGEHSLLDNKEINNVLLYNKKNKRKRFKGICIDIKANTNEELKKCYEYVDKLKNEILVHNTKENDNLKLSLLLEIEETLINSELLSNMLNLTDELILNAKNIKDKKTLSFMENLNSKSKLLIDNKNFNIKSKNALVEIDEYIKELKKLDNFDGFVIADF